MNPNHKIKPLLKHHVKVSNMDSYQDAFRKRDKGALHYKFEHNLIHLWRTQRKVQMKLLKVLKLATKSVKSIDLLEFTLQEEYIRQAREHSIIKLLSRTPNISIKSYHYFNPSDNFVEKRLKYLTGARNIIYQLWQPNYPKKETHQIPQQSKNLLRYLQFCPKIQSVILRLPHSEFGELKSGFSDIKQHPSKLKYFSIEQELSDVKQHCSKFGPFTFRAEFEAASLEYCSLIKFQKELRSIHLNFRESQDYSKSINDSLLGLSQLQEISLQFKKDVRPEVFPTFKKIAERRLLKKLSLSFDNDSTAFEQALESFSGLQLKYFSLKTELANEDQLIPIHKFIQSSKQLEYLELHFNQKEPFRKIDCLKPLCQEINKLEALVHLKLAFKISLFSSSTLLKLENIIPHLQDIFTKPIQLRTFHLMCNLIDTNSTLFSLIEVINPDTLHNLEIFLNEDYLPNKSGQEEITNFVQSLQNIRILKLYCFNLSQKQFLIDLAQAIQSLKYLRVFQLGRFGRGTITTPVFLAALEAILRKDGMESYSFPMTDDFRNIISRFTKKAPLPDLKQIFKVNPSLKELSSISELFNDRKFSLPQEWWNEALSYTRVDHQNGGVSLIFKNS